MITSKVHFRLLTALKMAGQDPLKAIQVVCTGEKMKLDKWILGA